jgi:NAD(P)-dependent dehydrogenase (short-subunit alcohol dehydrogenase family)
VEPVLHDLDALPDVVEHSRDPARIATGNLTLPSPLPERRCSWTRDERSGLRGRGAVVVGGGFGIGRAVARALAGTGARLALIERDPSRLSETCAELSAIGVEMDILAPGAARAAIGEAVDRLGTVQVLVNVVGRGQPKAAPDLTSDDQVAAMGINYLHHVECCSAFTQHCLNRGQTGAMTLVSSLSAIVPFPARAAYGAAKAALGSLVSKQIPVG